MKYLALADLVYQPQPHVEPPGWLIALIFWAIFCLWPFLAWRRRRRIKVAETTFEGGILRLVQTVSAFHRDRSEVNLGRMRAAAAHSVYLWNRLKSVDDDAEPDIAWVSLLEWARQQEQQWRELNA